MPFDAPPIASNNASSEPEPELPASLPTQPFPAKTEMAPASNAPVDLDPSQLITPPGTAVLSFLPQSASLFSLDRPVMPLPSRSNSDTFTDDGAISTTSSMNNFDDSADPQIIMEALRGKDRIFVLKLGEQMESLIKDDRRSTMDLNPTTSYHRLLVHRCSSYYKLTPETDSTTKTIYVHSTVESRIPTRRICDLVPAELPAQPTFKIMRRVTNARSKPQSQAGSTAGEELDLSDVEPSEAGSLGGRSNATGSSKKRMTIEEREAAYNEARSRIFMGFEEKEKEKDMSASSSSISLASGSATSAGGSSIGDIDDSVSSPTTEISERSAPVVRDKKEGRRSGGSSRSMRSNAGSYYNPAGSSRPSRAPSPSSVKYPSIYEPASAAAPYDPNYAAAASAPYGNHYLYAYPQPVPAAPNYVHPYPYYPPYQYPHSQQSPVHNSDPSSPAGSDVYPHHQQHPPNVYMYSWHQPPQQTPHTPQAMHATPQPPQLQQHPPNPMAPPPAQYSTYVQQPPSYGLYSMQGYYAPPPHMQHMQSSPAPAMHPQLYSPDSRYSTISEEDSRSYPGTVKPPSTAPTAPPARSAWSFGPGIGGGGGVVNLNNQPSSSGRGEIVGPRLSYSNRRTSGNSTTSSRAQVADEASSTASSSTTSSSSRRTYTSTASSQHPLPPRPDWAVGLKPQPTLHPTHPRHHDHPMNTSRNMSPAQNNGQRTQHTPPVLLQADFPPLSSVPAAEKRVPVSGVWNNASANRSILQPGPNSQNAIPPSTTAPAVLSTANNSVPTRADENGLDRPPPKSNPELFSPKGMTKPANGDCHTRVSSSGPIESTNTGDAAANTILADKVAAMSVEDNESFKCD